MVGLPKIIGRQVRRLRKESRWTQADLAEQISMSLDMIGRIERGQASPSVTTLEQLARALDCEPAHFLMNSDVTFFPSRSLAKVYGKLYDHLINIQDPELDLATGALRETLKRTS